MYVIISLGQIEILKHLGKNKTSHNSILPHSAGKSVSLTVICFTLLLFQYDLMAPIESLGSQSFACFVGYPQSYDGVRIAEL